MWLTKWTFYFTLMWSLNNNIDRLVSIQCSAGKPCASMECARASPPGTTMDPTWLWPVEARTVHLWGISCGVWHQGFGVGSFETSGVEGATSMDLTCSGKDARMDWDQRNQDSLEVSNISSLSHSLNIPEQFLRCGRVPCPTGGATAIKKMCSTSEVAKVRCHLKVHHCHSNK